MKYVSRTMSYVGVRHRTLGTISQVRCHGRTSTSCISHVRHRTCYVQHDVVCRTLTRKPPSSSPLTHNLCCGYSALKYSSPAVARLARIAQEDGRLWIGRQGCWGHVKPMEVQVGGDGSVSAEIGEVDAQRVSMR
jgi:hypothetical protein